MDAGQRRAVKARAKEAAKRNYGAALGIYALWYAATFAAVFLLVMLLGLAMGVLAGSGRITRETAAGILTLAPLLMVLAAGFLLVSPSLVASISFARGLWRQGHMSVLQAHGALKGRGYWNGVKLTACLFVRTLLWVFAAWACLVPFVFLLQLFQLLGMPVAVFPILLLLLFVVLLVLCVWPKVSAYWMAGFLLLDDPALGVWQATTEAACRCKGHYKELLAFVAGFLPWCLLIGAPNVLMNLGEFTALPQQMTLPLWLLGVAASILLGAFFSAYLGTAFCGFFEGLSQPAAPPAEQPALCAAETWENRMD